MQQFKLLTAKKDTYKLIETSATGKKTDIRDLVKKCPNCGLIWFRVEACPDTTCGNRPSSFFDFTSKPFSRYDIKRYGKKIIYTKFTKQNDLKQNANKQ